MSPTPRLNITRQDKKLMTGGLIILLLAFIIFLTLPALVDKKAIEAQVKSAFKEATGLDLEIQDGMDVSIFPTPHVTIHNLYVSNVGGASTSFLLSIHGINAKIQSTSLLSAHPIVDAVTIEDCELNLERLKNGRMNWQELQLANTGKARAGSVDYSDPSTSVNLILSGLPKVSNFNIHNTEVHFIDSQVGITTDYSDIDVAYNNNAVAKKSLFDARMTFGGLPLTLRAELGGMAEAVKLKSTSGKVTLESAQTVLDYEGEISVPSGLALRGKISFDSKNLTPWIRILNGFGVKGDASVSKKVFPLTLASDVTTEGNKILFPSIKVGGGVFNGVLNATLKMPLIWDIKGTMETVDFDALVDSGVFASQNSDKKSDKQDSSDVAPATLNNMTLKKSLWSYATFAVDVKADNVDYRNNHLKGSHIGFDMTDGDMTISQASVTLPGDSKILFTGLGKEGYDGFMLDGQLDASGENLLDATSVFFPSGTASILPVDFKRYRIKTNIVLSSKESRLTELTARVENMAFVGGVIITYGDRTKIQSAMRIGGVDLDKFFSLWGLNKLKESITTENVGGSKIDDPFTLWLRGLGYDLDVRASLEQFTLDGKQMEKCKFRVSAFQNKLTLSEVDMTLGESQMSGKIVLDVTKPQPFVDIDWSADTFDASPYVSQNSFLYDASPESSPEKPTNVRNWSHKGMDFQWLANVNSVFRLKVGQLKNGNLELIGFEAKGAVDDNALSFSSLAAQIKGAQFTGKGVLKGGKIPSVFLTGDVVSLDVADLIEFMPVLQGMSGKYNSHFRLSSSGIDVYTLIYNMEGNVTIAARDVTVEGFNLPGIVSAVAYVRTVADILDAVKRAYPGGSTLFTSVDGEWTVGSGVLKIPAIKLKNEFADGEFSGQLDIMNWKMGARLQLFLTYLDKVDPPKMAVNYTGNLDAVEKELDTTHLEQYVAHKTSEKLLQAPDQN